jgi:hypothetical protein
MPDVHHKLRCPRATARRFAGDIALRTTEAVEIRHRDLHMDGVDTALRGDAEAAIRGTLQRHDRFRSGFAG